MKGTLINKVREYLEAHPKASNSDVATALNTSDKVVKTYISRMANSGKIRVSREGDSRHIDVIEMPKDFKRAVYESMVEKYLEDFDTATFYGERVEIGKLILRILEKL